MPSLVVVGAQWGDEGKGKVVDCLARTADMVVRYQGGPNAGHTVRADGRQIVLHQIPTGILTRGVKCVIGCGCVLDPYVLAEELTAVRKWRVPVRRRLFVDSRTHMILPYHRQIDRLREQQAARQSIGTTGRGIGPVYQDKVARIGIRAGDLLDEGLFRDKLKRNVAAANFTLMEQYKAEPLAPKRLVEDYWKATRTIARMVTDGSKIVQDGLEMNGRVLFEGAQGVHLDIDLGTYPYVTTSSTGTWGAGAGAGVSPLWLDESVGVAKAYQTRVGLGPFPSEMGRDEAGVMRRLGAEFGATTGRPRRCGWFDAAVVRASVRYNRFRALVITKLDVLDSLDEIKVCTGYRLGSARVDEFDALHAADLEPRYVSMPGWREPTGKCRSYRELPLAARRYIRRLEEQCGCPVALVSVGSDRSQMLEMRKGTLRWLK